MLSEAHSPLVLRDFLGRLVRVSRYLASSKLHFTPAGVLELNPAPFNHAAAALPPGSPLAYAILGLRETCWSPNDLLSRRVMVEALAAWTRAQVPA